MTELKIIKQIKLLRNLTDDNFENIDLTEDYYYKVDENSLFEIGLERPINKEGIDQILIDARDTQKIRDFWNIKEVTPTHLDGFIGIRLHHLLRITLAEASRPELWWLRMSLIFAPSILYMITPFAVFLLPASWILLAISMIQPWYLETDVKSPSFFTTLFPLIGLIFGTLVFSFSTDWPIMSFIVVGWLLVLFSSKSIEFHIKQLKTVEMI